MSIIDTPDGIRFAQLASIKGRLSLESKGMSFKRGVGTTLQRYNEMFGTKFGRLRAAYEDACARVDAVLMKEQPDSCPSCNISLHNDRCALWPKEHG